MVTIGCGGIIINGNSILLMKRKNAQTFNELWSNPGGRVDAGESIENACIRELHEELNITVRIVRKLTEYLDHKDGVLFGRYTGFLVEIVDGIPIINEPEKASELKYWPLAQLPENLAPYTLQYIKNL